MRAVYSWDADLDRDLDLEREPDLELECERRSGDFKPLFSAEGDGEREADLARSSFPFSAGEAERLRDFLLADFSFHRPGEPRSDFTLEVLLERDWRPPERERDPLWDFCVREREWDLRERDLLEGDLERDLRPDLERDL